MSLVFLLGRFDWSHVIHHFLFGMHHVGICLFQDAYQPLVTSIQAISYSLDESIQALFYSLEEFELCYFLF